MKSVFVAQLDPSLWERLREDLETQGFSLSEKAHAEFAAKKPGISVTLYSSGKLVVQGKQKEEFITFYLEPEILKDFSYSHPESVIDFTPRIGVDEAGKGDFFGPLCISAVYADEDIIRKLLEIGVKDSKGIQDSTVIKKAELIAQVAKVHTITLRPPKYNELYEKCPNVNKLLAWAHATCIKHLQEKTQCQTALIDQFGHHSLVTQALQKQNVTISLTQKHKAEEDIVVAAASILARSTFLKELRSLGEYYNMTLPKGASDRVIAAGKKFIDEYGKEELKLVAKWHFKTRHTLM